MNLSDPVTLLPFVGESYADKLRRLDIYTVGDLIAHIPSRYTDYRHTSKIKNLRPNEMATIEGQVLSTFNTHTKSGKQMQIVKISDGEDSIEAIWFNQRYILSNLHEGDLVSLSGKISFLNRKLVIMFPEYEKVNRESTEGRLHTGRIVPIYPETAGVSSKWLRARIKAAFLKLQLNEEVDFIDSESLRNLGLIDKRKAMLGIHLPEEPANAKTARARLAFDELLEKQIENNLKKIEWEKNINAPSLKISKKTLKQFIESLDFDLTKSQRQAIEEILCDMESNIPMNRLLQGDVGSGKTVVAAAAMFAAYTNESQTFFMAPTQILAEQHYKVISDILGKFGARVALATSAKKIDTLGRADVVIGTHSLLHKSDENVGLVVIDEQHKFGVAQRAKFSSPENQRAHVLTMTATPIPRSVALTLYGELALSTLDELPSGRGKISTWIVPPGKRSAAEDWIDKHIAETGGQVFLVCPFIDKSERDEMKHVKAATVEHARIEKKFKHLNVGLLHGKMKGEEKSASIEKFAKGESHILVSTPVVEVGIDIPKATVMCVLGAERFGLSQIHQLRGRVGRGSAKSYCLLFSDSKQGNATKRLEALRIAKSGRELAEIDLGMRGPGEVFGLRQAGIFELKIAKWDDFDLIKKSREYARLVVGDQRKYKRVLDYFKKRQISQN